MIETALGVIVWCVAIGFAVILACSLVFLVFVIYCIVFE